MNFSQLIGVGSIGENFIGGGVKNFRTMIIQLDEEKLTLPVTPWKYSVQTEQNNKIVDILDFGENLVFGNTKLKKLKVSCFFPKMSHNYNFVVGDNRDPDECIDLITKWKEGKQPVRVIITDSVVNLMMGVDSFDYREKDGSRDVYYELTFIESREWNVPAANYVKQVDETSGLKDRNTLGLNTLTQGGWISRALDVLDKSKMSYGNFSSLGTFKTKNSLSRLSLGGLGSSISKSWSW